MPLTPEDRLAITDTIAMHGHLVDDGALDRLDEVFTEDVVYDLSAMAAGRLDGVAAVREAALALGDANPVAHHVTNVVVSEEDGRVSAVSKGLGVLADGRCGSVVYEDSLVRTEHGWRITARAVIPRRRPLGR